MSVLVMTFSKNKYYYLKLKKKFFLFIYLKKNLIAKIVRIEFSHFFNRFRDHRLKK